MPEKKVSELAKLLRYWSLTATTAAGSGHATSSLSAADLVAVLASGGLFHYDIKKPLAPGNDRLIFSKGHASPLFYAFWAAVGAVPQSRLLTLRKFRSDLEGHPTMRFPFTEAATGSLGQGLSVGVGMALKLSQIDRLNAPRVFVLLGDSEMAEGQVWEAMQLAVHYKLSNLIGILDVNGLGQRGSTMYRRDTAAFAKRISAFGWKTIEIDGHDYEAIAAAYRTARKEKRPVMIIAKTVKGKGVSFIENKNGWHGRALTKEELKRALAELGQVNERARGVLGLISRTAPRRANVIAVPKPLYRVGQSVSTRQAYGEALRYVMGKNRAIVALDAEVSNSTYARLAAKEYLDRFFEMFIAEQNMVSAAVGFSRLGAKPFVSTFGAFLTRAADQIRMSQYSRANIVFSGSHAGVSIGEDGPSQMALEDLALFRAVLGSVILYPSDAVSTRALVERMAQYQGISYLRTTRSETPVLYNANESFPIGGSKTLRRSAKDSVTIVAAGITIHEALKAADGFKKQGIAVRVIDCYSVKPIDASTLRKAARETGAVIIVEDHYAEGGLGEAVLQAIAGIKCRVAHLAVRKMPRSGTKEELLAYEGVDAQTITSSVNRCIKK